MTKWHIVKECRDCKWCQTIMMGRSVMSFVCNLTDRSLKVHEGIPEWCPLEDVEEEQDE